MASTERYCPDGGCCALFGADGTVDALALACCPFCGSHREETGGQSTSFDAVREGTSPGGLQLSIVQGPVGRRYLAELSDPA